MLQRNTPDYERQIGALSDRVYAYLRAITPRSHDVEEAAQDALLELTIKLDTWRIGAEGLASATNSRDRGQHVFEAVTKCTCRAAFHALLKVKKKRQRLQTGGEFELDREVPANVGSPIDRDAALGEVRDALADYDEDTRLLLHAIATDMPRQDLAEMRGKNRNATYIDLTRERIQKRLRRQPNALDRLQRANAALVEADGHYGATDDASARLSACLRRDGCTLALPLQVGDLAWHLDGFLRGMMIATGDAARLLPAVTFGIGMVAGRDTDEQTHVATQPFVLQWTEHGDQRHAPFAAWLGERTGRGSRHVPATALRLVLAG